MPVAAARAIRLGSLPKEEFDLERISRNKVVQQAPTAAVSKAPNRPKGAIPAAAIKAVRTISRYEYGIFFIVIVFVLLLPEILIA